MSAQIGSPCVQNDQKKNAQKTSENNKDGHFLKLQTSPVDPFLLKFGMLLHLKNANFSIVVLLILEIFE